MSDPNTVQQVDHIPGAWELIREGGNPGVRYAQVCIHNMMRAQQDGWRLVNHESFYRIVGPKGHADMALMKKGDPIPGGSADAGARVFLCDPEVLTLTGLNPNPDLVKESADGKVDVASRERQTGKGSPEQNRKGDARV